MTKFTKSIRSVAEAIGIIEKEVSKMGENKKEKPNVYCIECNATVTHVGAHFCGICAGEFYNEGNSKEGTE